MTMIERLQNWKKLGGNARLSSKTTEHRAHRMWPVVTR
jgi:hypothetical protein